MIGNIRCTTTRSCFPFYYREFHTEVVSLDRGCLFSIIILIVRFRDSLQSLSTLKVSAIGWITLSQKSDFIH